LKRTAGPAVENFVVRVSEVDGLTSITQVMYYSEERFIEITGAEAKTNTFTFY
jgi:hypothetical protein